MRCNYLEALRQTRIMERLAGYDPHVAGTPPLGIEGPDSDIDVLCHAADLDGFAAWMVEQFGGEREFSVRHRGGEVPAVVAGFRSHGWEFEIFCQSIPVERQMGWRHFLVERRLLGLGGEKFRAAIREKRREGLKTEPAFAAVLGLEGDPYQAVLRLGSLSHDELTRLVEITWSCNDG